MVKTVIGVSRQGFRDWLIQRISALVMTIYTFGLFIFFANHPDVAFFEWHALFTHHWMKIATALCMISLLYHAWIGMWTIYTDYIKNVWFRLFLEVITLFALMAFFIETLLILWSV